MALSWVQLLRVDLNGRIQIVPSDRVFVDQRETLDKVKLSSEPKKEAAQLRGSGPPEAASCFCSH